MGGFAAPVRSDPVPAAAAPVAASLTADAPALVGQLQASRLFLDDHAFANLLRNNDAQLAGQLGRFGWHGRWVEDADYIADFDRLARATAGSGDHADTSPILTPGIGAPTRGAVPGAPAPKAAVTSPASAVPPNVEAAMGIPPAQRSASRVAFKGTLASPANQALGDGWAQTANPGEAATLTLANSRRLFNNQRGRFWRWVRSDPAALAKMRSIGARFPEERGGGALDPGAQTIPEIELPDGTILRITLDHEIERQTAPGRALDVDNIRLSTWRENTATLRQYAAHDPFINPPSDWVAMPRRAGQLPAEPEASPPATEIAPRSGIGATAMSAFGFASMLAVVGQTADQLHRGKPVAALKTAGLGVAIMKLLQRFPKLGPLGLAIGTLLGYDEHAEDLAMRGGSWVEDKLARHIPRKVAHVAGGVAASGTALGVGFYQGVVAPVGSGLYAGATILKPTHASFPSLGPGSSRFKARIDSHNEGCQTCHDAVRVDNWAKEHPEMTRLLTGPGSLGGIPTDELLKVFEANAFPLNERLP